MGSLIALLYALAAPLSVDPGRTYRLEFGSEHLWPSDPAREIETTAVNLWLGRGLFGLRWLGWRAGLTGMWASGSITQLGAQFHPVHLDNDAAALGPAFALRLQTPELLRLSLALEGSGAFLLYSAPFPAGGDIYNFAWRGGVQLELHAWQECWLAAGYRAMHVSNGQGLGPQNPSYKARGVSLWISWPLW